MDDGAVNKSSKRTTTGNPARGTVPVVGNGGIGDTTGTVPFGEERLGNGSRGVPGLPAVKIDSEPAVASIPAVFAAVLKVPTLLPRPSKSLVHYMEGIGNIGQSREQTRPYLRNVRQSKARASKAELYQGRWKHRPVSRVQ